MAALLSAQDLSLTLGARTLFSQLQISLEEGERAALIGPNGAGKSSLMKVLVGKMAPDTGTVALRKGCRLGYLEQSPTFNENLSLTEAVMDGDDIHEWENTARALELLSKLQFTEEENRGPESLVGPLSGGWKKRLALARELYKQPDILFLDEPTNHLDVEGILWLEEFLQNSSLTILMVTHDRVFLDRVCQRILELDRRNPGGLLAVPGNYSRYLEKKSELLSTQQKLEDRLKNTLRRETEWLKRGAKARTTKQQARIKQTHALADTVEEVSERNRTQELRLQLQTIDRSPKRLLEAKGIRKSFGGKEILKGIDLFLGPKSRLGLVGKNGSGKSTLIKAILGELKLDQGEIFRSDQLQILYFQQNRDSLDPAVSLKKTVCPEGDQVILSGKKMHVNAYLDQFLFSTHQYEMPVGNLSGGEQSRILLAKLFTQPANMLILDEPTNDLDIPTLNVLEDLLRDFPGAIVLVSHDRYFLGALCDQILALEEKPERFGDILQWESWKLNQWDEKPKSKSSSNSSAPAAKKESKEKLTYKEERELAEMESKIQGLEEKLSSLTKDLEGALPLQMKAISAELNETQVKIDSLFARWTELENKKKATQ